jgi:hypothetical protein
MTEKNHQRVSKLFQFILTVLIFISLLSIILVFGMSVYLSVVA